MIRRIDGKPTRTYLAWKSMRARVRSDSKAHVYRDRGISCCKEWDSFEAFYFDLGECPEGFSLERIDVNKGYSKDNCKWIPLKDQAKNKQKTIRVVHQGQSLLLKDFCKLQGIKYSCAWKRLKNGYPVERISERNLYEKIEWQGQVMTYSEAAKVAGLKRKTLQNRIKIQGWSVEKAMTTPVLRG